MYVAQYSTDAALERVRHMLANEVTLTEWLARLARKRAVITEALVAEGVTVALTGTGDPELDRLVTRLTDDPKRREGISPLQASGCTLLLLYLG